MLIRIESSDNGRIRLVRKLGTRKGRTAEGRFVIEGLNLCREAVLRSLDIDFLMIPDNWESSGGVDDISGLKAFTEDCISSDDLKVCMVPSRVFTGLTDAGTGIGIIAVLRIPHTDPGYADKLPPEANILVLDRIQDPGNIGTMIRTAVAAGYGMIIASKGTADIYSAKVLRATAGMIFDIPFAYAGDYDELAGVLKKSGRRVVVTDPSGGRPYYREDLSRGIALVIGNEGNGVSSEVMALADVRVTLPMKGSIESLNAAVSAAILMYEAVRTED
jgi:TrmH family RNA methyltransferase